MLLLFQLRESSTQCLSPNLNPLQQHRCRAMCAAVTCATAEVVDMDFHVPVAMVAAESLEAAAA